MRSRRLEPSANAALNASTATYRYKAAESPIRLCVDLSAGNESGRERLEAGFRQGAPSPGEALPPAAPERRERDARARRVDHPAAAQEDADVVDTRRPCPRPGGPEEDEVGGSKILEADAGALGHLPAHRRGRPAVHGLGELRSNRVPGKLVDPPYEAGTVEATRYLSPEWLLGQFARSAPDVGVADQGHCLMQDPLPPASHHREVEFRGLALRVLRLP